MKSLQINAEEGGEDNGTLKHCWWECTLRPLKRTGRRFPKKTKMPYDPEIPLLGRYLEKMKTNLKKLTHPMFTAALFTIAET